MNLKKRPLKNFKNRKILLFAKLSPFFLPRNYLPFQASAVPLDEMLNPF